MLRTSILISLVAGSLCIDLQGANAGLLGMPLNLRAAIGSRMMSNPATNNYFSYPLSSDDLLTGSLLEC
jgi:hypothetical protein